MHFYYYVTGASIHGMSGDILAYVLC